ncbi:MAG: hypothetical protein ACOCXH_00775 [Cyclobacteriaceae bacterium]
MFLVDNSLLIDRVLKVVSYRFKIGEVEKKINFYENLVEAGEEIKKYNNILDDLIWSLNQLEKNIKYIENEIKVILGDQDSMQFNYQDILYFIRFERGRLIISSQNIKSESKIISSQPATF